MPSQVSNDYDPYVKYVLSVIVLYIHIKKMAYKHLKPMFKLFRLPLFDGKKRNAPKCNSSPGTSVETEAKVSEKVKLAGVVCLKDFRFGESWLKGSF